MPSIAVPALPANRFAEFKEFVETAAPEGWDRGDHRSLTWEDAGRVAANLYLRLGDPGIIAGREGDDALERWLGIFGTRLWRDLSRGVGVVPVPRLNAWCRHWLTEFYAHQGRAPAVAPTDATPQPPTPTPIKPGDPVQWTSGGVDQFATPQRVEWVSDDGCWARVEGSMTGIPVAQVTVFDHSKPLSAPQSDPKSPSIQPPTSVKPVKTVAKSKPTSEKFVDDYIAEAKAAGISPSMRGLHRARDDDKRSLAKYGCTLKGERQFGYGSLDNICRTKGLDKNSGGKPAKPQR